MNIRCTISSKGDPFRLSNNLPLDLKSITFLSNNISTYVIVKLLFWKWLSQRINNVLINGHFLYDYIMPTNDLSNQVVTSEYVFGSLMRPWFLCLSNGSIVITIQRYWINNSRQHFHIQTASLFALSCNVLYFDCRISSRL